MKTFICLWFVLSVVDQTLCGDQINITAKPGDNVTLTCRAAGNSKVSVLRLTRDDLEPDSVLLYRNDQIDEEQQHPQYKGRTKLQSLISTDGEINLTLDSVTEKDSGVYECRVMTEIKSNTRRKRAALESTIIHLRVDPGNQDGNRGEGGNQDGGNTDGLGVSRSHAALVAAFAAVSVVVSMVIAVIRRKSRETSVNLTKSWCFWIISQSRDNIVFSQ